MSMSEIADNRWEAQAASPPVLTAMGLAQIGIISAFGLFFGYMLLFAVIATVTPHEEGQLEKSYREKLGGGAPAGDTKPAESK